ncbi:hypothetical protein QTH89_13465 [Variovorax sp. J22G21]|uniref:hypothetical protein n=1 Tax=Variovorax fucosicus TaxID=3053517 RepID=UPI002574D701|nr:MULTISPECIES: hypothetical protein [unclassified Variovorax]MDM0037431.1 hypothetical protein [Variovorax sp. J22R193]MDM0062207.1 hypothetical protein [Variovorax sp. J22G21]
MNHIALSDWTEFEPTLRRELAGMGHHWLVTVRNFERVGFEGGRDVDRFKRALKNGTDRTKKSDLWNEPEHDFDHDRNRSGKKPDEVIYAFTIDLAQTPYKVLHKSGIQDVADSNTLNEGSAIIVYDFSQLERKSENEYWFKTSPKQAALLIFTVEERESDEDAEAREEDRDE